MGRSTWLLVVFGTFAGACEIIYLAEVLRPALLLDLALTRTNWWGIVTSVLVHISPWHIASDASSITLAAILMFLLANWRSDWDPPVPALCVLPFASAFLANVVFYFVSPNPMSAGSSGVGYAMLGVTFAYSLDGTLLGLGEVGRTHASLSSLKESLRPVALYLGVSATMTAQVLASPASFLNAEPGVNFAVHGIAFIIGLSSMYFYTFYRRMST